MTTTKNNLYHVWHTKMEAWSSQNRTDSPNTTVIGLEGNLNRQLNPKTNGTHPVQSRHNVTMDCLQWHRPMCTQMYCTPMDWDSHFIERMATNVWRLTLVFSWELDSTATQIHCLLVCGRCICSTTEFHIPAEWWSMLYFGETTGIR